MHNSCVEDWHTKQTLLKVSDTTVLFKICFLIPKILFLHKILCSCFKFVTLQILGDI